MKVWELRQTYRKSGLSEDNLPDTPYRMLTQWMEQAIQAEVTEPNAMSLATVKPDDTPDVRMVLLKEIEDRKSTRLNSSHVAISYAVFCLKKKISIVLLHY